MKTLIWVKFDFQPKDQEELNKQISEGLKGLDSIVMVTYGNCDVKVFNGPLVKFRFKFLSFIQSIKTYFNACRSIFRK
jgi:UDP-N-acetylglucosamine transferase subunit ALG13